MDVEFSRRDFSPTLGFPGIACAVEWFTWRAQGGPHEALVVGYGEERHLWRLLEWLRAPVMILESHGEPVWWGYVHEVTISVGPIQVGVSLDGMYNRVAVAYSQLDATESGPGVRATTPWALDDDSVSTYGTRELLASLSQSTAAAAADYRDSLVAAFRYPTPVHRFGARGGLRAMIRCVGWWHTLWWQYYANAGTAEVATTTQIATIVAGEAPFLLGVDVVDSSGISTNENRSGDEPAGQIVDELLRMGTTNNRRLLATVTRERYLRIQEEPVFSDDAVELFMPADGRIYTRPGSRWIGVTNPAGRWVALTGVIPATLAMDKLADPGRFFAEEATYHVARGLWIPEPRGLPSAWDLAPIREG